MSKHADTLNRQVEEAIALSDEALFRRLGESEEKCAHPDDEYRGPAEELGQKIFSRWSERLHQLVCEPVEEDEAVRDQLTTAIFTKGGGAAALVAGLLVSSFSVSPPLAAAISALLFRIVIDPAGEELCNHWAKNIEKGKP